MAKAKKTTKDCQCEELYQKTLVCMQKKLSTAYAKLKKDMTAKASITTIRKDSHDLLLLLGELNYLEKECKKLKKTK